MTSNADRARIDAAMALGDVRLAARLADQLVATSPQAETMLLNLAAWHREQLGDFARADAYLQHAQQLTPDDPLILTAIGRSARAQRQFDRAQVALTAAIAQAPNGPAAWLERAMVFDDTGALVRAQDDYRRASELDPASVAAKAGLAYVCARLGDAVLARTAAASTLALDPQQLMAVSALARVDIDAGEMDRAVDSLCAALQHRHPALASLTAYALLGEAFERQGQGAAAFDAYSRANDAYADAYNGSLTVDAPTHREFIEAVTERLALADEQKWCGTVGRSTVEKHVFLLGYPRSGTTLMETILASAGEVETLEERPTLADADQAFLGDRLGLTRLAEIDVVSSAHFQSAYWVRVAAQGVDVAGKTFVDMDPLKTIRLPIIAKLFPEAKLLMMRRDPRDVVWSCFRTSFAPSSAANEFTDLSRAAQHYAAMMTLTDACLAVLPIDIHIVRYENLIADFDRTTKAVCDYLGIQWSVDLRRFDRTAATRDTRTASVAQVRKPLYNGTGQWRVFSSQFEEVMPILQPWIDKFGY